MRNFAQRTVPNKKKVLDFKKTYIYNMNSNSYKKLHWLVAPNLSYNLTKGR